jgi:hypothetical protein
MFSEGEAEDGSGVPHLSPFCEKLGIAAVRNGWFWPVSGRVIA